MSFYERVSTPLSAAKIRLALEKLPGWRVHRGNLSKTFQFKSFREAMSFMVRVSFEAEGMNHHPEWSNSYNKVVICLNTHDAGSKVTVKDTTLAGKIEAIAWV